MMNLAVSNALRQVDVKLVYEYITSKKYRGLIDIEMQIDYIVKTYFNGVFGIPERDNVIALYNLSGFVDITNPYACYDFISKMFATILTCEPDEVESVKDDVDEIQKTLSIQFGSNWMKRLIKDKVTFDEILEKYSDVSPFDKEELNSLACDIIYDCYTAREKHDDELADELEYQYEVVNNYIKYTLD